MNDVSKLPRHVAFIMDGNGRWAQARESIRSVGHYHGVMNVRDIAIKCSDLGIEIMTVFLFSKENWSRSKEEIDYLFKLPRMFFNKYIKELIERNIKITCIGDLEELPTNAKEAFKDAMEKTKDCNGMTLCFAINYGSKQSIVDAVRKIIEKEIDSSLIDMELISKNLSTADLGDVDLLIRTSGEYRISNFLLWEIAYAELYFTDAYWPDFDIKELEKALTNFANRKRRFGGITK